MKQYVIITYDIHPIGGTQAYTAGKARYLEKQGWKVVVFFSGTKKGNCAIGFLNRYLFGGVQELGQVPYRIDDDCRDSVLLWMMQCLNNEDKGDIIVESHYDVAAFWGELLAERVLGRHYVFCCNEYYRNKNGYITFYKENLDFFAFKFWRNELIGAHESIRRLFNGYKGIKKSSIEYPWLIVEQDAVQDIASKDVDLIPLNGWNICSIGRLEKPYIEPMIEGICALASDYPKQTINFIVVGDATAKKTFIENAFRDINNVNIVYLGVLVPIPRALFAKVDVVIAAAQTAVFVSYEQVYTIAANVMEPTTPGVLGYDTQDAWYGGGGEGKTYKDVLEDVLVHQKYNNREFVMPARQPAEDCYEKQWKYLEMSNPKKEYYTEKFHANQSKNWLAIFPYWRISAHSNILIYGAGTVGRDYVAQLEMIEYYHVAGVVDQNADQYDDSVVLPQIGLTQIKYDVIVIAVVSELLAEEIRRAIVAIVKGKPIIHDFKRCLC